VQNWSQWAGVSLTRNYALLGSGGKTHNRRLDHYPHEFATNSTDRNENATLPNKVLLSGTKANSRAKVFN
jgi:hypothetical protein